MHYEINYNHLPVGQSKRDKAIADITDYLTPEQFNVMQTIAMITSNYSKFSFVCAFAGISGYPVVALWDETRQTMRDMTT